ncbi:class I SAM-dependent methyltransferase, partial [Methylobacterium sp. WL7]|uniref:class I SAM-dependent methyltransferase n=1 Tax=Methylobacterium sp. WL7 TaxID=2603900 RepID=UPI0011CB5276
MSKGIPNAHHGMHYHQFMSELSSKRSVRRHLEIGIEHGKHFSMIHADQALGIDPYMNIQHNVAQYKRKCVLVQLGSDQFFQEESAKDLLGGPPDLAFLDGMHTFEYLLRDFFNTERISAANTLVALHDCLPLTAEMALRDKSEAYASSPDGPYREFWTGDVWKVIPILQEYRPDIQIVCVDCPPTGVVFLTNLNPESRTLQ